MEAHNVKQMDSWRAVFPLSVFEVAQLLTDEKEEEEQEQEEDQEQEDQEVVALL